MRQSEWVSQSAFTAVKWFRYTLARFFFRAIGIDLDRKSREVDRLWRLDEKKRNQFLNERLRENRPQAANGKLVCSFENLSDAPVLSKTAFREQKNANSASQSSRGFSRHTAGTTGEPTNIRLSTVELAQMLGVREYCFNHYGLKLGEREARLWGRPTEGCKGKVRDFLLNRSIFHPGGTDVIGEVLALLAWRPDYVYGYASLILEAARIIREEGLVPEGIRCVICTAETILPSQKVFIADAFNCPVAEEYGSTEFDIVAFECREGHRHLVNPWLHVEVLDEQCVISDVSRQTQDLIRYQIGDVVNLEKSDCRNLGFSDIIGHLEGRSIHRFAYGANGERFHAVEFAYAFDRYMREKLVSFSFTILQDKPGVFRIELLPCPDDMGQDICEYMKNNIKNSLDIDVELTVEKKSEFKNEKRSYFLQSYLHH